MKSLQKIKKTLVFKSINENDTKILKDFFNKIKENKHLLFEYQVIENLSNKTFSNKEDAIIFIKENLNFIKNKENRDVLLKSYKFEKEIVLNEKEELIDQLVKLNYNEITPKRAMEINERIGLLGEKMLISENTDDVKRVDMFEGLKPELVIKTFLKKFDETYQNLSETEIKLLKSIINEDFETQKECYSMIKNNIVKIISEDTEVDIDLINETVNKINQMEYNEKTLIDDIDMLYDLIS